MASLRETMRANCAPPRTGHYSVGGLLSRFFNGRIEPAESRQRLEKPPHLSRFSGGLPSRRVGLRYCSGQSQVRRRRPPYRWVEPRASAEGTASPTNAKLRSENFSYPFQDRRDALPHSDAH